jgi:AcrR family transcriptional regulator
MSDAALPASPADARKAARQAEKRQRILTAARLVLQEHGAAGLTVTAVARAAHLSPPAIYYWFDDMQALTQAIAEEMLGDAMRAMVSAVARAESGLDALEAMMRAMVGHYTAHPDAFLLLHDNVANTGVGGAFRERVVFPRTRRLNGALQALLLADKATGRLHAAVDVAALTQVAWCTALGILSSTLTVTRAGGTPPMPADALLTEAVAHLRRGARPVA